MMQRVVDNVLAVAKESIKTITQESFNNTVKLINGFSALILAVLPGRTTVMEGLQGWELRPTFRAPRLPRWMEEGVSSFNQFLDEYESEDDYELDSDNTSSGVEDYDSAPPSPCSSSSHFSRSSSGPRHDLSWFLVRRILRFFTWPIRWLLGGSAAPSRGPSRGQSRISSSQSLTKMYLLSRQISGMKDYGETRRRGIIEDLQLVIELGIERIFDTVRWMFYPIFSPLEALKIVVRKIVIGDTKYVGDQELVDTDTLGDAEPSPTQRYQSRQQLNTDGRTCEDIITSLGYPYEALRVVTPDGHVLLLERIPRRQSRKALYLQHGILDSSLGWVSNGVVGSQAFAAYDQGYDVYLGNFRGLASREHVNKHISPQRYWRYSVNEHGTMDIPSMIDKIHEIKTSELERLEAHSGVTSSGIAEEQQPYKLCAIAHSLGGAGLLMYVVTRRLEGKQHRLSRLILLSPAGFHEQAPASCYILQYLLPAVAPFITPFIPGFYIPTRVFRMLFNKLARDFQNYPALGGLVQMLMSYVVGGDSSNWVGAIGASHYNMDDMPGVAYRVALHLAQMMRSKRFIMYDFGSPAANIEAYGTPYPLDIGAHYGVIDIPVDVVAGRKDRLVPKSMVLKHYETLKASGCEASYEEFEYAHLDFTFSHREELLAHVMSKLLLVTPQVSSKRGSRGSFNGRISRTQSRKEARRYGSVKQVLGNNEIRQKEKVVDDSIPSLESLDQSPEKSVNLESVKPSASLVGEDAGCSYQNHSSAPATRKAGLSADDVQENSVCCPTKESPQALAFPSPVPDNEGKNNDLDLRTESSGEFENEVGYKLFGNSSFFAFPASHVASAMATAAMRVAARQAKNNQGTGAVEGSGAIVSAGSRAQVSNDLGVNHVDETGLKGRLQHANAVERTSTRW